MSPRHLGKNAQITPLFLWFCPDFCGLVHVQSVLELFAKRQNNALPEHDLNKKKTTTSQNFSLARISCSNNARIFPKISLDYARIFAKMRLDEELVALASPLSLHFEKFRSPFHVGEVPSLRQLNY